MAWDGLLADARLLPRRVMAPPAVMPMDCEPQPLSRKSMAEPLPAPCKVPVTEMWRLALKLATVGYRCTRTPVLLFVLWFCAVPVTMMSRAVRLDPAWICTPLPMALTGLVMLA